MKTLAIAADFAALAASMGTGGKPTSDTPLKSIASADGTQAATLRPMHADSGVLPAELPLAARVAGDKVVRLVYGLLRCEDAAAPDDVERLAVTNGDAIRHDGRRLVLADGQPVPGAQSCSLMGVSLLAACGVDQPAQNATRNRPSTEDPRDAPFNSDGTANSKVPPA